MKIRQEALDSIRAHGAEGYPEEICGIMLGPQNDGIVTEIRRVRNLIGLPGSRWPELTIDRRKDRYEMDPLEQMRIHREADDAGLDVVGYYHSHPDHPAEASKTDASQSSAGYVYLIVAINGGDPEEANAFVADNNEGPFHSEPLEIV